MHSRLSKGLTIVAVLGLALAGCNSDRGSNPPAPQAPTLPRADRLTFKFDFFKNNAPHDRGQAVQAGKENFFNASVRVAVIGVVTDFILTPPITAFALALSRTPILQPDGSYLWIYTYVEGTVEAQVRLRGRVSGDHVDWEMRVSSNEMTPPAVNDVWFEGTTWRDGDKGTWNFHDFTKAGKPVVARIEWDDTAEGESLVFTDLEDNPGDELALHHTGDLFEITYHDVAEHSDSFIKWYENTGAGSLRVPDYNGGHEACWDRHQNDVSCTPAL